MFKTFINAFKVKEIRRKILITFALILVYRIGCYIPVPGVNLIDSELSNYTYFQIMNAVSGSALQYGTLFAMGIGPYINASIIIQLLTVAIPKLEQLSKQGEEGRKKISNITRIVTIVLAIAQAIGILLGFKEYVDPAAIFGADGFAKVLSYAFWVIMYTAGASLTMWIGERITDHGISNGISILIFVGIVATIGQYAISTITDLFNGGDPNTIWELVGFVVAALVIFAAIVAVDRAERKIPVQYAKQIKGRKMYGGQSTHIPIKVNGSGVMPLIFAFAILSFPDLIINMFGMSSDNWYSRNMGTGSWLYTVVLCALILFFAYFYNQIQFNPDDVSKSIQQNGGFIPGIRPGKPTADHLKRISNRIVLFGAIFLAIIALIPSIVFKAIDASLVNVFSATGLLIIVSVALEINQGLESQIMMKNYKGFLK
ncbi:MAG: preprotein translocase subunit SecY [Clostridia bacterium]|nr:preprotein translocase subunit SecY [Clostridia bacterium]